MSGQRPGDPEFRGGLGSPGDGATGGSGAAVDWELLADHLAGALAGQPAEAEVARRVAEDPAWATAGAELAAADTVVRGRLAELAAELAAEPEPLPPDVAARLDEALAGAGDTPDGDAEVRSLDAGRARRSGRLGRYRVVASVAAGVVVLAGVAGVVALNRSDSRTAGRSDAANHPMLGPAPGHSAAGTGSSQPMGPHATAPPTGPGEESGSSQPSAAPSQWAVTRLTTGTDYRPDTLAALLHGTASATPSMGPHVTATMPDDLSRLSDSAALDSCLTAIDGDVPGTPSVVDFARFEGSAALVVVVRPADGQRPWVVVAGPRCGVSGDDVRYRSQTG